MARCKRGRSRCRASRSCLGRAPAVEGRGRMRRLVSIDGKIAAPEEATVSVYDRGFLYGDAVFETLRTYDGVPFAAGEHAARLARSAARIKLRMPMAEAALV